MSAAPRSDPAEIAAGHLASGRVAEARAIYERILRDEPTHARALCGLGAVALRGGEVARAFELIGRAAAIAPADGMVIGNLGVVHLARKAPAEAEDCFRRALDLDPERSELHANLALVLLSRGDHETALKAQRYAVELAPASAEQRFNLAAVLVAMGRVEAAAAACEEALAIDPAHVGALNNLSVLRKQAGRLAEAEALLEEARLHDPMNPELLANHADFLLRRGRRDEALGEMRRAAGLAPGNASLRAALGVMLIELGRLADAGRELAAAARGAPDRADVALALARLLLRQGRLDDAQEAAERAARQGSFPGAADALATELLLLRGRHAEAWERLDARAAEGQGPAVRMGPPRDLGLAGTELRLVALDPSASLFAARFIAALAERGATPTVLCAPVLVSLMAAVPGVAGVVPAERLDLAALAGNEVPALLLDALPHWLRVTPEWRTPWPVFAARPGQGSANGSHQESTARPLGDPATLLLDDCATGPRDESAAGASPRRVGLWWEGPGPGDDLPRALAGTGGVRFVSLQSGDERAAALALIEELGAADRGGAIDDFQDLAAALGDLDIMVAPDGPIAHLAAGTGVETWVLVGRDGSWYWPGAGARSPWYPASRAFRQSPDGTWTDALAAIRAALAAPGDRADPPPPAGGAA